MKSKLLLYLIILSFPALCTAQNASVKRIDSTTESDNSYGKNGTKTTIIEEVTTIGGLGETESVTYSYTSVVYKDSKGTQWERVNTSVNNKTLVKIRTETKYDKSGKWASYKSTTEDAMGNITSFEEERYEDGKIIYGVKGQDAHKINQKYNPKTEKWDDAPNNASTKPEDSNPKKEETKSEEPKFEKPKHHVVPDLFPKEEDKKMSQSNSVSFGPAYMHFGDKSFHYNSFGFTGEFTHNISSHIGITGDVGFYWHNVSGNNSYQNYSQKFDQYNYTAGITYMPCSHQSGDFLFYTHALAGVSTYKIKNETNSSGSNSSTTHSFTFNLGVGEEYHFTNRFAIGAEVAYAPTFFFSNTQNNYRIGANLYYKFPSQKEKKKQPGTTYKTNTGDKLQWFANISTHDFDPHPPLFKPDDEEMNTPLENPHRTEGIDCNGKDAFDYHNKAEKEIIGTLVVKNRCKCRVHVLVQIIKERPGKNKIGKSEGDTKEKEQKGDAQKNGKEKLTKLLSYDVDNVLGSDIYSFKIPKESWIRITIDCTPKAKGNESCDFTRNFSVTTEKEIIPKAGEEIPRLPIDPPTPVDKIEIQNAMGNRCISKDTVFYKIYNDKLKDIMKVYFRAVSECDCYFEAFASNSRDQEKNINPLEGGELGVDAKHNDESQKIAKPAINNQKENEATEEHIRIILPKEAIFIKGRCPKQQQRPGPCKGSVKITGITYTSKK